MNLDDLPIVELFRLLLDIAAVWSLIRIAVKPTVLELDEARFAAVSLGDGHVGG